VVPPSFPDLAARWRHTRRHRRHLARPPAQPGAGGRHAPRLGSPAAPVGTCPAGSGATAVAPIYVVLARSAPWQGPPPQPGCPRTLPPQDSTSLVSGEPSGALLSAAYVRHYGSVSPAARAGFDPAAYSLSGFFLAQLAIGVLGVLVLAREYATGTIRSTLAAAPQRGLAGRQGSRIRIRSRGNRNRLVASRQRDRRVPSQHRSPGHPLDRAQCIDRGQFN
jgi:hypothetical protein